MDHHFTFTNKCQKGRYPLQSNINCCYNCEFHLFYSAVFCDEFPSTYTEEEETNAPGAILVENVDTLEGCQKACDEMVGDSVSHELDSIFK